MTYVVRRLKPKLIVFITTGTFNLLSKTDMHYRPKRMLRYIKSPLGDLTVLET